MMGLSLRFQLLFFEPLFFELRAQLRRFLFPGGYRGAELRKFLLPMLFECFE
jgi:hypothetical protein